MRKNAALLVLLILIVSGVMMVAAPACAAVPKPSVPEFTLNVVAHPYDVAPTTTVDPYTGNVTTQAGYHVENKSIEVTIKNQPFSPYNDGNGNSISLYYNVTVKGHFEDTWDYCFNNPYRGLLNASDSDYTIISMPIGYHRLVPSGGYPLEGVDAGDQIDFQVQAQIGYYTIEYTGMWAPVPGGDFYYVFTGEASGWSNTQTITIGESTPIATPTTPPSQSTPTPTVSASPSQNPTATPESSSVQVGDLFGLDWERAALIVMAVVIVFLAIALVVLLRRKAAK